MHKLSKNKQVKIGSAVLSILFLVGLVFANLSKLDFKASEIINTGSTQVANLTTNLANFPGSKVPKYEQLELTFDINRSTNGNNLNEEIDAGTINPYWPYDPNPAPNQYFDSNHPDWNSVIGYSAGNNHVQDNGTVYACVKDVPGTWTLDSTYFGGGTVRYNGKVYLSGHSPSWAGVKATNANRPDLNAEWVEQPNFNQSFEPGGAGNWQEYWFANPASPIPAGKGISVDALLSKDNFSTEKTVAAFYYQDYATSEVGTTESLNLNGSHVWKVRFAPTEEGDWSYRIRITDKSGITTYSNGSSNFSAVAAKAGNHGFAQVSKTDPRYFELSDGTTLLSPGMNENFTTENAKSEIDTAAATFGDNGVKTIRYWMDYRGWQNPFGGGDVATGGGPQWGYSLTMSTKGGAKPGDKYSALLPVGKYTWQDVNLQANVLYRFSGYIKTEGVVGSSLVGVYPLIENSKKGEVSVGDNGWTKFTLDFTPTQTKSYRYGFKNDGTAGTGYFDDASIKASTDGGSTWSDEIMKKGDMDFQNYIEQTDSYYVDYIFQKAAKEGIYLKTIVTEKQDTTLGSMGADGTPVGRSDDNFYAGSSQHASRWTQQAWWRYLNARWGSYTSLHSWELANEGDPFNTSYYNAINSFADYMHTNSYKPTMASSSMWTGYPMEFWKNSSADYIDVHEYTGNYGSNGKRLLDWSDGASLPDPTTNIINDTNDGSLGLDYDIKHSGTSSLKLIAKAGTGNVGRSWPMAEYHIGIDPTHTYTVKYWAKAQDVGNNGGGLAWTRPEVMLAWSKAYHNNDWVDGTEINTDLGTYDWKQVVQTGIKPPDAANVANISVSVPMKLDSEGSFWIDDIEFIDETTGENLYVGGSFDDERMDYDTALMALKYSTLFGSFSDRFKKPVVWGETGITGDDSAGHQFSDYQMPQLSQDVNFIYLKKMIWPHLLPGNVNMLYWYRDDLEKNNGAGFAVFKAFQTFISDLAISNGEYKDASATTSSPNLRAWGQKEIVDGKSDKVHLWIDNAQYTWKNVVDNKISPHISGTITIPDMKDGRYKVEWWNTSNGTIERAELRDAVDNKITLSVTDLESDTAVKIYPTNLTAQKINIISPSNDSSTLDSSVTVQYKVDNGDIQSQTFNNLVPGSNHLEIRAVHPEDSSITSVESLDMVYKPPLNLSPSNFSTSWNMVSFPGIESSVFYNTLFANVLSSFKIRKYDGSNNTYLKGETNNIPLTLGSGYWLKVINNTTDINSLRYPLNQTSSTETPVNKGWNILGNPFQTSLPLSNLSVKYKDGTTRSYSEAISRKEVAGYVWSYEGSIKQYIFIAINPDNYKTASGITKQTTINPFRGFWTIIKSDQVSSIVMGK